MGRGKHLVTYQNKDISMFRWIEPLAASTPPGEEEISPVACRASLLLAEMDGMRPCGLRPDGPPSFACCVFFNPLCLANLWATFPDQRWDRAALKPSLTGWPFELFPHEFNTVGSSCMMFEQETLPSCMFGWQSQEAQMLIWDRWASA